MRTRPGTPVYAYEEAIGHCVDPAVRDKARYQRRGVGCRSAAAPKKARSAQTDALDELV